MIKLYKDKKIIADNIDLIIFDKDGTLVDIHHYWSSMIKLRSEMIVKTLSLSSDMYVLLSDCMGIDQSGKKLKPKGPVGIKPRRIIIKCVYDFLVRNKIDVSLQEVENIFIQADKESQKNMESLLKILDGVREFLNNCRMNKVRLAIATTDITQRAELAMGSLGMLEMFDVIAGSNEVAKSKPAGDLGELILRRMGISGKNTVMIGDHRIDMEMARNAGIDCAVAVTTGLSSAEDLEGYSKFITDSFNNLNIEGQI